MTKTWELIMATRKMNFGFLVCFLIATFVGQTLSQTRRTDRTRDRLTRSQTKNIARKQKQQELDQRRLRQEIEGQLKKQMGLGKSEKESMEQVLRATEEQWKAIKPKLNKVRKLKSRADVSIRLMRFGGMSSMSSMAGSSVGVKKGFGRGSMSGFGSSSNVVLDEGETVQKGGSTDGSTSRSPMSWKWQRPSQYRGFENLNEGEKICEELFRLLEDRNSELEEIRQKIEALQKFRQETKKELAIAQKELRQLVTPRQEAALVMMQLLD
jgi:chromosome segregation ATPase